MMNVLGVIVLAALCAGLGWYFGTHAGKGKAVAKAEEKTKGSTLIPEFTSAVKTVPRKLTRREKKVLRKRGKEIMRRKEIEKEAEQKAREAREKAILTWKPDARQVAPVCTRRSPSLFWSFLALGAAVHYLGAHPKKNDTTETAWRSSPWMSVGVDCDMAGGSGALGNDCGAESFGAGDGDFLTEDTLAESDSGFGGGDFRG